MNFQILSEEKTNVIVIEDPKGLKKYKKLLRKEKRKHKKNEQKIRNIEQAIEEYNEKKCEPKIVQKPVEKKPTKSKGSDEMLEEEFQKNKGYHRQIDNFEKNLKEERRRKHQEFIKKKEFERKKVVANIRYKKKYMELFNKWIESRREIKKTYTDVFYRWKMMVILEKYIQEKKNRKIEIILKKWKMSFPTKAKIKAMSIKRFFNQWKNTFVCDICCKTTSCHNVFKCGHSMCNDCADKWFKSSNKYKSRIEQGLDAINACHMCRSEVKRNDTVIKYNPQYIDPKNVIEYLEEEFISKIKGIDFCEESLYACNMLQQNEMIIDSNRQLIDIYRSIYGEKGMRYAEYFIEEVINKLDYRIEIKEFIVDHFRLKLYPSVYHRQKLRRYQKLGRYKCPEGRIFESNIKFGNLPDDWRNKCEILNNSHGSEGWPEEWKCSKCGERCKVRMNELFLRKCFRCDKEKPAVPAMYGSYASTDSTEWICCLKGWGPDINNCRVCSSARPNDGYRPFFSINRYQMKKNGVMYTYDGPNPSYHSRHIDNPSIE